MGQLMQLSKYHTSEQRQVVAQRGYSRFLARRHHRKMQKAAERRKRQELLQD